MCLSARRLAAAWFDFLISSNLDWTKTPFSQANNNSQWNVTVTSISCSPVTLSSPLGGSGCAGAAVTFPPGLSLSDRRGFDRSPGAF